MKVKLNTVRVAFAQSLTEAKAFEAGQEERYGCTFLIPEQGCQQRVNNDPAATVRI